MNLLNKLTTHLTYNDFFDNVKGAFSSLTGKMQGISLTIIIACLVIIGVMFIFGEGPSRTAKKWLIYVIVGGCIVFGATTLGNTIKDVVAF